MGDGCVDGMAAFADVSFGEGESSGESEKRGVRGCRGVDL